MSSPSNSLELIAAPYTPFKTDGSLALDKIGPYAEVLLKQGVSGAFICGTTGEGVSLTIEERLAVAEEWVKVASPLKVIVHVGHNCLADARALARHAERIGAHATSAMAPCFFGVEKDDILVDCCAEIAGAAPSLPFFYYHMPARTHINLPVAPWLERAAEAAPNLAGVKYTYEDLQDFEKCRKLRNGHFKCFFGRDERLLSALDLGATAAVGSTYNYMAGLYLEINHQRIAGHHEEARRLQALVLEALTVMTSFGVFGSTKSIMQWIGVDCGAPRLPLPGFDREKTAEFRAKLEAIGLLDFIPVI